MKYIIILGDGMADEPLIELEGKTPLEYADTPAMDELAGKSEIGLVKTIPDGMKPGSDTANLAVLGYNPKEFYTGRSPLEALSIGVPLKASDVALRANFVTLTGGPAYEEKTIVDHSAGEISTEDAAQLLQAVRTELEQPPFSFYTGTSYRHLMIWDNGEVPELTPPHDILGKKILEYLPEDEKLRHMMQQSFEVLNTHPLNLERAKQGKQKANSLWFWGAGTKPKLTSFEEKTGKRGVMISAVDLLKGIAAGAGMTNRVVEGADGTLHTNYKGKALAAVEALTKENFDFAYIHIEAPDEMGHQGSTEDKIKAIESIDREIVQVVIKEMQQAKEDYRMLILPDHPTPVHLRTHTAAPVPYLLYDSTKERKAISHYNEKEAKISGIYLKEGWHLIDQLLEINQF